jgi:enamine deaminase RidA (YjgF/YER057c/UK114 family)
MPHTIVNPNELHDPTSFGYSHSVAVSAGSDVVLVAGQWASSPDGQVTATDFGSQVEQVFANLRTVLAAHGLELRHVAQLRTYVVGLDFQKLGDLGAAVGGIWGASPPANTVVGVAALATPELTVEIEAVAVAD